MSTWPTSEFVSHDWLSSWQKAVVAAGLGERASGGECICHLRVRVRVREWELFCLRDFFRSRVTNSQSHVDMLAPGLYRVSENVKERICQFQFFWEWELCCLCCSNYATWLSSLDWCAVDRTCSPSFFIHSEILWGRIILSTLHKHVDMTLWVCDSLSLWHMTQWVYDRGPWSHRDCTERERVSENWREWIWEWDFSTLREYVDIWLIQFMTLWVRDTSLIVFVSRDRGPWLHQDS